jgi:predicted DNA-binding transcriptional regulator AlpA
LSLIAVSVAGSARRIADADLSLRRSGEFPRSRMVGDRTVWVECEIDAWIAALPNRQLKGDAS